MRLLALAEEAEISSSELLTLTVVEFADRLMSARTRRAQAIRMDVERLAEEDAAAYKAELQNEEDRGR
jgi:hypothetical protein